MLLIISEANLHYSTFVNIKFNLPHVSLFKVQTLSVLKCTRCKFEHHYLITHPNLSIEEAKCLISLVTTK